MIRILSPGLLFGIFLITLPLSVFGQKIGSEEKKEVVEKTVKILRKKYVYPDKGEKAAEVLLKSFNDGAFNEAENTLEFSNQVTARIRTVIPDKHLGLVDRKYAQQYRDSVSALKKEKGIFLAKQMEDEIGYLQIRSFVFKRSEFDGFLAQIRTSKAIIFDLRDNYGGNGTLSTYVMSYFLDGNMHFANWMNKDGSKGSKIKTSKKVGGERIRDTPLFILINSNTFSAAESIAYNLQVLGRATIIGETSAGGAHTKTNVSVNKNFYISLPGGRSEDIIKHGDWEEVGVKPDVESNSSDALEVAIEEVKKILP